MDKLVDIDMDVISELRDISKQTGTDLLNNLINIFCSETPVRIAAIKKAWIEKDFKELGAAAHSLKSGSAYLGAQKLSALAAKVEDNSSSGNFQFDFETYISQMDDAFQAAEKVMIQKIKTKKSA